MEIGRTVAVGVFDDRSHAEIAVKELVRGLASSRSRSVW